MDTGDMFLILPLPSLVTLDKPYCFCFPSTRYLCCLLILQTLWGNDCLLLCVRTVPGTTGHQSWLGLLSGIIIQIKQWASFAIPYWYLNSDSHEPPLRIWSTFTFIQSFTSLLILLVNNNGFSHKKLDWAHQLISHEPPNNHHAVTVRSLANMDVLQLLTRKWRSPFPTAWVIMPLTPHLNVAPLKMEMEEI